MPRSQTAAAERTEQNRRLKERALAETGRAMTVKDAQGWARAQKRGADDELAFLKGWDERHPDPSKVDPRGRAETTISHLVPDRILDIPDAARDRVGEILARVVETKMLRKHSTVLLHTSPEYGHLLTDLLALSGHPLLVTFETAYAESGDGGDGDGSNGDGAA